jgi:hypothetical protein
LAEDIKKNGLIHPIVIHDGAIVDGRNRYVACRIAGVKRETVAWTTAYKGSMSLLDWIASENVRRRHLTRDQIAVIFAQLEGLKELEESRKRQCEAARLQGEHGKKGGRGKKKPPATKSSQGVSANAESVVEGSGPKRTDRDRAPGAREKVARAAGVSQYAAQQALNVAKADPNLADAVRRGETPLHSAHKEVQSRSMIEASASNEVEPKPKPKKTAFNVANAINGIIGTIDKILDGVVDDDRKKFVTELIEMLEERK